jgi:hypothetical protein
LLYALEQGPQEQWIIEQSVRKRMPLPKAILNAPELWMGLELFYTAFMDLTTCRPLGMSEGPIPWTAIVQYCDRNGIEDEQREDMFFHLRSMDTAYLKHRADTSKAEQKKNEVKPRKLTTKRR